MKLTVRRGALGLGGPSLGTRGYARFGETIRSKLGDIFGKTKLDNDEVSQLGENLAQKPASCPLPTQLTPAQWAFSNRIGFNGLPKDSLIRSLNHPNLIQISEEDSKGFQELALVGRNILQYFVNEYVHARFPRLPRTGREMAKTVYTSSNNLAEIAKSLGLEYALVQFEGLPHINLPPLSKVLRNNGKPSQVLAETLLALIGTLTNSPNGATRTRQFLDAYLFTATFDTKKLCKPAYPILMLAKALKAQNRPETVFRLLHESGRTSNSSMFVVGAFAGNEMLGEGYGASVNLAEHRAALEALQKMYLVDVPNPVRPSDVLLDSEASETAKQDFGYEAILKKLE